MKIIIRAGRAVTLLLIAFVDLLTILPVIGSIVAFFRRRITVAFIVHPGTINEAQKWWKFVGRIEPRTKKESLWEWILCHLWPISGQRIIIQNGKRNVIRIIYLSLTAELIRQYPEKAEKQSIKAAKLAERLGANFIGLGGQVPGNCQYGLALKSGSKKVKLTTGHAYSLGMVYAHTLLFSQEMGIDFSDATIAIVGAGSMGRGMALLLSKNHEIGRMIVLDLDENVLCNLANEVHSNSGVSIETSTDLNRLVEADIIISVASTAEPIIMQEHIKPKAVRQWNKILIIEDGYPACVSSDILERKDVVVVAGGATKIAILRDNSEVGFGLFPRGYTVSCLAELIILMLIGWRSDYTLGKVDIALIDRVYSAGVELGFYPGCLSNDRRLNKVCRQQVEPRGMLFKLINNYQAEDPVFSRKQIELTQA